MHVYYGYYFINLFKRVEQPAGKDSAHNLTTQER